MTFHPRRRDHYSTLGLDEAATFAEIRQAYRSRAKEFHPDLNTSRHAREAFLAINDAHYVLRDPMRRQAYDEARDEAIILWGTPADVAPPPARRPKHAPGWLVGAGLAGALGAAALLVLADSVSLDPSSGRAAVTPGIGRLAAAPPPVAEGPAAFEPRPTDPVEADVPPAATADVAPERPPEPQAAALDAPVAPAPPGVESWQANATQGQVPPFSALDVLAEVPPAAPLPAAALAAKQPAPLARRTAAALVSQVRKAAAAPVRTSRYQAAVQAKARYAAARARYAAAHAAKARTARKQHRVVRKAMKRRYAAT